LSSQKMCSFVFLPKLTVSLQPCFLPGQVPLALSSPGCGLYGMAHGGQQFYLHDRIVRAAGVSNSFFFPGRLCPSCLYCFHGQHLSFGWFLQLRQAGSGFGQPPENPPPFGHVVMTVFAAHPHGLHLTLGDLFRGIRGPLGSHVYGSQVR